MCELLLLPAVAVVFLRHQHKHTFVAILCGFPQTNTRRCSSVRPSAAAAHPFPTCALLCLYRSQSVEFPTFLCISYVISLAISRNNNNNNKRPLPRNPCAKLAYSPDSTPLSRPPTCDNRPKNCCCCCRKIFVYSSSSADTTRKSNYPSAVPVSPTFAALNVTGCAPAEVTREAAARKSNRRRVRSPQDECAGCPMRTQVGQASHPTSKTLQSVSFRYLSV